MRDLPSTLSYLLDLPVPFSNLGQPILSLLPSTHDYLLDCFHQILAFLKEYSYQYLVYMYYPFAYKYIPKRNSEPEDNKAAGKVVIKTINRKKNS